MRLVADFEVSLFFALLDDLADVEELRNLRLQMN